MQLDKFKTAHNILHKCYDAFCEACKDTPGTVHFYEGLWPDTGEHVLAARICETKESRIDYNDAQNFLYDLMPDGILNIGASEKTGGHVSIRISTDVRSPQRAL